MKLRFRRFLWALVLFSCTPLFFAGCVQETEAPEENTGILLSVAGLDDDTYYTLSGSAISWVYSVTCVLDGGRQQFTQNIDPGVTKKIEKITGGLWTVTVNAKAGGVILASGAKSVYVGGEDTPCSIVLQPLADGNTGNVTYKLDLSAVSNLLLPGINGKTSLKIEHTSLSGEYVTTQAVDLPLTGGDVNINGFTAGQYTAGLTFTRLDGKESTYRVAPVYVFSDMETRIWLSVTANLFSGSSGANVTGSMNVTAGFPSTAFSAVTLTPESGVVSAGTPITAAVPAGDGPGKFASAADMFWYFCGEPLTPTLDEGAATWTVTITSLANEVSDIHGILQFVGAQRGSVNEKIGYYVYTRELVIEKN